MTTTRRPPRPGYCFKCEMLRKFKASEPDIAADHANGHPAAPAREASTAPSAAEIANATRDPDRLIAILHRQQEGYNATIADLRATVAALTADRDALRDVVESFALVERHAETRANGCSDLYRMPFAGSSWFDSREAAVTDWLAVRAPRGTAR